jgi:hypothetical protein
MAEIAKTLNSQIEMPVRTHDEEGAARYSQKSRWWDAFSTARVSWRQP